MPNYAVTILDETWGNHAIVEPPTVVGCLADAKSTISFVADTMVRELRAINVHHLEVRTLPTPDYRYAVVVEYMIEPDDLRFAFVIKATRTFAPAKR